MPFWKERGLQANKARAAEAELRRATNDLGIVQRVASAGSGGQQYTPEPLADTSLAMFAKWQRVRRDYGVVFTEVSHPISGGNSQSAPFSSLIGAHALTGLGVHEYTVKGNYESLELLERFLMEHVVTQASMLERLRVKGASFEFRVQVVGTAKPQ
jgi:hypothetical protein